MRGLLNRLAAWLLAEFDAMEIGVIDFPDGETADDA
jgi:hypothetical protein